MQTPEVKSLYILKQSANQHLKSKEFPQASVYFSDILSKFAQSIQTLTSQQQMQRAIKQLKLPAHKNLSLCHLKLNQPAACIQQCEQCLQIEPNCIKILYRIGRASMALKRWDEAQRYLKRGFAIDPHEEEILKALEQIEGARNFVDGSRGGFISLRKIVAIVLYLPIMILNMVLMRLFGRNLGNKQQETMGKGE